MSRYSLPHFVYSGLTLQNVRILFALIILQKHVWYTLFLDFDFLHHCIIFNGTFNDKVIVCSTHFIVFYHVFYFITFLLFRHCQVILYFTIVAVNMLT